MTFGFQFKKLCFLTLNFLEKNVQLKFKMHMRESEAVIFSSLMVDIL